MAILNIFKKKPSEGEGDNKEKKKPARSAGEDQKPRAKKAEKKAAGLAWSVLSAPHVTEKATDLAEENKYVFKVFKDANKTEIKKSVEKLYGVNVEGVRIINIPKKKRRVGKKGEGWRKGYKKAMVKIKSGQKIEILPR